MLRYCCIIGVWVTDISRFYLKEKKSYFSNNSKGLLG
jgi:hypothetical protein